MKGLLVIVPCGQRKIWDSQPNYGPAEARDAYTGSPFTVNKEYARQFGEAWVILSAKYGLVQPTFIIPGPYNVTFKKKSTGPVKLALLREQMEQMKLDGYESIVGLGGKEYRCILGQLFDGRRARLHFPFAGLSIGKAMHAINEAIKRGDPFATSAKEAAGTKASQSQSR